MAKCKGCGAEIDAEGHATYEAGSVDAELQKENEELKARIAELEEILRTKAPIIEDDEFSLI